MRTFYLLLLLLFSIQTIAQNGSDMNATVRLEVAINSNNSSITLIWPKDPNVSQYQIYKKSPSEISWGLRIEEFDGSTTFYKD